VNDLFDAYSRRARLLPGAIVVLPVTLFAVVLITAKPAWWTAAASVVGASGLTYFGTQLIRSFGTSAQAELWQSWGGPPSTALLRFAGAANATQVSRWHRLLAELCPDEHVPNQDEENADTASADAAYGTLVSILIARTRDRKQFGRIFDENCQYGFRRNLYGCRPIGLYFAAGSFLVVAALVIARLTGWHHGPVVGIVVVGVFDVLMWSSLKWIVTPGWVREAANAYAARLIESIEILKAA
jgi:hypothetical protein